MKTDLIALWRPEPLPWSCCTQVGSREALGQGVRTKCAGKKGDEIYFAIDDRLLVSPGVKGDERIPPEGYKSTPDRITFVALILPMEPPSA